MNPDEILNNPEKLKILVRIIAHLMGDGCVSKKYFAYFNKNETLLNNFKKDITDAFGNLHFITGKVQSGTSLIQIKHKETWCFLTSLVKDYRSFSLRFPGFINTKELQKNFLSALFDDEGCVALRTFKKTGEIKRNITFTSKSKLFAEEIKHVLETSFDIQSNKINEYTKIWGDKRFVIYTLSITGKENFVKFRDEINFSHPLKKEKLDAMINSYIRK
ncbi:MAG: hypothetical protein KKE50_04760 [Nanoarchaeota archaeon]|nr:hypothetical protein [Nanoarchaeota archaeon]